jgi:hypothetical protein
VLVEKVDVVATIIVEIADGEAGAVIGWLMRKRCSPCSFGRLRMTNGMPAC